MNAHTPGPWRIERRGSHNPLIETDGLTVAEVLDDCHPDTEQQEANARLIAAAPCLLDALRTMTQMWNAYVSPENYDGHAAKAFSAAVDALQKATTGDTK